MRCGRPKKSCFTQSRKDAKKKPLLRAPQARIRCRTGAARQEENEHRLASFFFASLRESLSFGRTMEPSLKVRPSVLVILVFQSTFLRPASWLRVGRQTPFQETRT
jgi:hypothetical protein